jgi:hypothetical protein
MGRSDEGEHGELAGKFACETVDAVIFEYHRRSPLPDRTGSPRIEDGHAFIGMHSASDTFHGFPGFLDMLQSSFRGWRVPLI